jgi:hypothetical protein
MGRRPSEWVEAPSGIEPARWLQGERAPFPLVLRRRIESARSRGTDACVPPGVPFGFVAESQPNYVLRTVQLDPDGERPRHR